MTTKRPALKPVPDALKAIDHAMGPEKVTVIHGEKIAFVEMDYDTDNSNPLEDGDENGSIHSFNRRHGNFIDPTENEFENLKEEFGADLIPLSYYEHGQSMWFVAGSGTPAGVEFQWDGTRYAGVWAPDAGLQKYAADAGEALGSPERVARMEMYAKQACETYTDWCNGSIYYYSIEVYTVRKDDDGEVWDDEDDYRRETPIDEESCGGFYGWDDFKAEVMSSLKNLLDIKTPKEKTDAKS
jgi:hypothetical protein